VDYFILLGIIGIIYLLWSNSKGDRYISSNSSDWLILVSNRISTVEVKEGRHLQFIPIIGWKYNYWSHKFGYLTPITPPIYRVTDKLKNSNGNLEYSSYWIRDGREYDISTEWTSGNDFWSSLTEWVSDGQEIITHSHIPECLRPKYLSIINKNQSESS